MREELKESGLTTIVNLKIAVDWTPQSLVEFVIKMTDLVHFLGELGGYIIGESVRIVCRRLAGNNQWSTFSLKGGHIKKSIQAEITTLVDRGDLFNEVTDYLKSVLIPYYQRNITKLAATSSVVNGATCTVVKSAELAMRKEAMAEFLVVSNVVDRVKEHGGKVNKTVRINDKSTMCLTLPKSVLTKKKWQEIVNKIFEIQDEDVVDPEEQAEAAEAHLPQPDRVLNMEPVFPSLPPISPTTQQHQCVRLHHHRLCLLLHNLKLIIPPYLLYHQHHHKYHWKKKCLTTALCCHHHQQFAVKRIWMPHSQCHHQNLCILRL
ncbi:uncharacterized protein [Mytilus edulis]|uniref:uncharacterized protein n=1 Tax=Mytilus edulis TaxID=6550 RepID=UPI0039EF2589